MKKIIMISVLSVLAAGCQTAKEDKIPTPEDIMLRFRMLDANRSNTLSLPEFRQVLPNDKTRAEMMFLKIDANRDMVVSPEEWLTFARMQIAAQQRRDKSIWQKMRRN